MPTPPSNRSRFLYPVPSSPHRVTPRATWRTIWRNTALARHPQLHRNPLQPPPLAEPQNVHLALTGREMLGHPMRHKKTIPYIYGKNSGPHETFDFLGYTFGRLWSPRTGRPYLGVCPSKKRIQRLCEKVTQATDRRSTFRTAAQVVADLNPMVQGWANYFSLGSVSKAYRSVDLHVGQRLRMWLNAKHKVRCAGRVRYISTAEAGQLGLKQLRGRKGSLPWATA